MYEEFFGLREKPFSILPDSDFLYLTTQHERALLTLEYGIFEQTGITVLTGGVGCGKTTIVRKLLKEVSYDAMTVGLISNVHESLGTLLDWVTIAFDLPTYDKKIDTFRHFQSFVVEQYIAEKTTLLIIDEAQNLSGDNLEELRMLMNINADKNHLLQILLVGQPELETILAKPELIQIAQRVTCKAKIEQLTLPEVAQYIPFRLRSAGAPTTIFSDSATRKVFQLSKGVPRIVNVICDRAMVLAYGAGSPQVECEHIE
ncbi:MAG: AAA family ATPase [Pseudomonadota bacterium]